MKLRFLLLLLIFASQTVKAIEPVFSNVGPDLQATIYYDSYSCSGFSQYLFELSKKDDAVNVTVYKARNSEQENVLFSIIATIQLSKKQVKDLDKLLKHYRELPPSGSSTSSEIIKIEWKRQDLIDGKPAGFSTPLKETISSDTMLEDEKKDFFTFSDFAAMAEKQKP